MSNPQKQSLEAVASAWKHAPHELISLWDMIQFQTKSILKALEDLNTCKTLATNNASTPDSVVGDDDRKMIIACLQEIEFHCKDLHLCITRQRAVFLINELFSGFVRWNWVEHETVNIEKSFSAELSQQKYVFIPKPQSDYFDRSDLFGLEFHEKATKAINLECRLAGNCLAADLNTAAVFHLMRVAEHGLHALANHLLPDKTIKPYPLEYSEWGKIISAIEGVLNEKRVKDIKQMSAGPEKDAESEFYNGLISDLSYFKDAYRNPVSHLRGTFTALGALGVNEKVKGFMLRVAIKVPLM